MSVFRHLLSILLLPGTVTVGAPALVLYYGREARPLFAVSGWPRAGLAAAGVLAVAAGLMLVIVTIRWFAAKGRGTLAPWDPPRRLVIKGVCRHMRNPMYAGVFSILLGEALVFNSALLLMWFGYFLVGNLIYTVLVEEPGLVSRFGEEYLEYKRHVPRWVPRIRPWLGPGDGLEPPPRERMTDRQDDRALGAWPLPQRWASP